MVKISKNVLSDDLSPYLKQHKDNPVNWQIWSEEILSFAKMYKNAPEGFVLRNDRPEVMRAGILGRFRPIETTSELVSTLEKS